MKRMYIQPQTWEALCTMTVSLLAGSAMPRNIESGGTVSTLTGGNDIEAWQLITNHFKISIVAKHVSILHKKYTNMFCDLMFEL